ncbi:hypothetical protein LZK98_17235 [Sphingomonas cannabina]|uniref:DUF6771 family protein n=1 Tax=Sphingomonas cannabina TaxID=2899123 RepID=UPI001F45A4BF|nr:DUF6771 family protein [Sphingomonas cannabina]UIJ44779.1 hypothetical protein LZK98_17235 [Sphingomonas cannabina]
MTRLDSDLLGTIARAIEEAPLSYRQGLASANDRQRLRAADALAGWIGATLAAPAAHHDVQLALPIDERMG